MTPPLNAPPADTTPPNTSDLEARGNLERSFALITRALPAPVVVRVSQFIRCLSFNHVCRDGHGGPGTTSADTRREMPRELTSIWLTLMPFSVDRYPRTELVAYPAGCKAARCYAAILTRSGEPVALPSGRAPPPSSALSLFEEPSCGYSHCSWRLLWSRRGCPAVRYDVAISGGGANHPETGLDAARNIGIRGGTIEVITVEPLQAARTIDASGLVVARGFIELFQHAHDPESYRLNALDGVTSSLDLEVLDGDTWDTSSLTGRALLHYGTSAGHAAARVAVLDKAVPANVRADARPSRAAPPTPEQLSAIRSLVRADLDAGKVGVNVDDVAGNYPFRSHRDAAARCRKAVGRPFLYDRAAAGGLNRARASKPSKKSLLPRRSRRHHAHHSRAHVRLERHAGRYSR